MSDDVQVSNSGTTVWVATRGSYSDYDVIGVFSTEEDARGYMRQIGEDENEPKEFVVDDIKRGLGARFRNGKMFSVFIDRDGMAETFVSDYDEDYYTVEKRGYFRYGLFRRAPELGRRVMFSMNVFATDEQHAIKMAGDRRAWLIASGNWPPQVDFGEFIEVELP